MKQLLIAIFAALCFSASAFAHKPGMYKIDKKDNARVVFDVFGDCPKAEGALKGRLRTFTFSEGATAATYGFKSGFYVETHDDKKNEIYVQTDYNCVPTGSKGLPATKTTLNGFEVERLN